MNDLLGICIHNFRSCGCLPQRGRHSRKGQQNFAIAQENIVIDPDRVLVRLEGNPYLDSYQCWRASFVRCSLDFWWMMVRECLGEEGWSKRKESLRAFLYPSWYRTPAPYEWETGLKWRAWENSDPRTKAIWTLWWLHYCQISRWHTNKWVKKSSNHIAKEIHWLL